MVATHVSEIQWLGFQLHVFTLLLIYINISQHNF
jgi:hypothetical protein